MRELLLILALSLPTLAFGADQKAGQTLAQGNGCFACHAVDAKVFGPAYKDVAARYAGKKEAVDTLIAKVKKGGGGTWGPVAMPPHPQLSDADARSIIEWVLSLKS